MQTFKSSVRFNAIYVIEMHGRRDDNTGEQLFREVIEPAAMQGNLLARHFQLESHTQLVPLLWKIATECAEHDISPILHIDSHGSKEGLVREQGELVTWASLRPALQRINTATRMNLLVTLGACYGAYLVNSIHPEETLPFWGLIGPTEQVFEVDVRRGFALFYQSLAENLDLHFALLRLRTGIDPVQAHHWVVYPAETIFALGFGKFYEQTSGPGARRRDEKQALKANQARRGKDWRPPKGFRSKLRRQLGDYQDVFDRYRQRFFMLDRFPENDRRFQITMDEAIAIHEQRRSIDFDSLEDNSQD